MDTQALIALAKETALARGLDPALVCAICEQESNWDTTAIRYEPAFFDRYIVPLALPNKTEERARAFSWGLLQVMGQVARENGFTGSFLSELCDPAIGLAIGCKVLAKKLAAHPGSISEGLLAYNGGADAGYPPMVLARVAKYEEPDVKIV